MDLTDLQRTPKRIATLFLLLESQVKNKERDNTDLKLHITYYEDINFGDELESIFNLEIAHWETDKSFYQRITYNHEKKLIVLNTTYDVPYFYQNTKEGRKFSINVFIEGLEYAIVNL